MMKAKIVSVLIVLICAWPSRAVSQEANPAYWFLTPLITPLGKCAGYSPDMKKKVEGLIVELKVDTKDVLPPSVPELMMATIQAPEWSRKTKATTEQLAACERMIQAYRGGGFLRILRSTVNAMGLGELGEHVNRCIAQHPEMEGDLRNSWTTAMKRDDFSLTLEKIKSISDANHGESDKTQLDASMCKRVLDHLSSPEFDKDLSIETLAELFKDAATKNR